MPKLKVIVKTLHNTRDGILTDNEKITDEAILSRLTVGMEKAEVESLLGKPASIDFTDAGNEKWLYWYFHHKATSASNAGGKQYMLTLLFDDSGKLEKIGKGEQDV